MMLLEMVKAKPWAVNKQRVLSSARLSMPENDEHGAAACRKHALRDGESCRAWDDEQDILA